MENTIKGFIENRILFIDGNYISPRESQKVCNHSPDGFNWGYGGSGPAQLALAIMLEFTDRNTAWRLYQDFKWKVVSKLTQGKDFELKIDIKKWIKKNDK